MVPLFSSMEGKEDHTVLILPILAPHNVVWRGSMIPINFSHKLGVESQSVLEIDPRVVLMHIT